ncbi:helix-turn-helix domain-containing protein [Roseobacter sp. CCS2]|uniref:helix-turn-helix domain-containing protein n=1 Tax=Roseobacter sp. CCS2 TaxID=391593 RepID=UPI0000F40204|nr:helix-turn-helix domain-containing protein [Roseobacter sp. CCS2]EBA14067.1 transcriptional regulator, AraC family protein [Roseobacter sp. CCS2]
MIRFADLGMDAANGWFEPKLTNAALRTKVCYCAYMSQFVATDYPNAEPLTSNSSEMATARIKVIIASRGYFYIAGRKRTAFVVGSCAAPIEAMYSEDVSCTEFSLPAWVGTAVLGVSGRDLSHDVHDISDMPQTPFLSAVQQSAPDALDTARMAYMNWSAGRGTVDAHIAQRVWHALQADPTRQLCDITDNLELSDRRIRAAVKQETGLSPAQWRKLIRLEKSSHAIASGTEPLAIVALEAGYADQSHMNRDFMELAGVSPLRFRQTNALE